MKIFLPSSKNRRNRKQETKGKLKNKLKLNMTVVQQWYRKNHSTINVPFTEIYNAGRPDFSKSIHCGGVSIWLSTSEICVFNCSNSTYNSSTYNNRSHKLIVNQDYKLFFVWSQFFVKRLLRRPSLNRVNGVKNRGLVTEEFRFGIHVNLADISKQFHL